MQFRSALSLAQRQTFAIDTDLAWQGFGLPKGRDGKRYSLFGPGQAILAAPFVALAKHFTWPQSWPIQSSHYVNDDSIKDYFRSQPPKPKKEHILRFFVSFLNSLIGALAVLLFWFVAKEATGSEEGALFAQFTFAFGTIFWPYTTTFFSEPLATAFILLSFHQLLSFRSQGSSRNGAFSGLFLGMASTVHLSALLFAPFFLFYLFYTGRGKDSWRGPLMGLLLFVMLLVLLGAFNHLRFGSFLETGRGVDVRDEYQYGRFVSPLIGLYGLTSSGGRGLFIFCPILLISLYYWSQWDTKEPLLSRTIGLALLFRLLFIASRSDWYGGFCLGPRYLVMVIPFLLLPLAFGVGRLRTSRGSSYRLLLFVFLLLAVCQQIYFCSGDVFYDLHLKKFQLMLTNTRVTDNEFASSWEFTTIFGLLDGRTGPWWAALWQLSPTETAFSFMLLLAPMAFILWKRLN